ncbi:monocarboxylate transporter 10-like isoform X2 [Mercenaria mercenaria]|uniref:monocarboxylate transporter 10-like isoform X2 n=1 Tax=Mercenaria mercenaria TaxID=6596 RepID=UPI00234F8407|nr:monocarboxylate transporter 10-like isoform X2 [Mercenaria mercenaria]
MIALFLHIAILQTLIDERSHPEAVLLFWSQVTRHLEGGWSYMILFASFGTCCLIGANNYGTGIIHKILLERYNESVVLTSLSGSLQLALGCMSAPLSSAVIDKYSCRTSVILSGILYICGYWATAFAPNMQVAVLTCGVTAGIAAGLGYTSCIVAVGFNFRRRKNIALGITLSGMGAGIFAFAPLMDLAHAHYGSTGFFIVMAAMSANIITFGTLCFPSKLEIYTHKQREIYSESQTEDNKLTGTVRMYSRSVLKKPIVLLSLATFAFCGGTDLIFLNLPAFVVFKGFTSIEAAMMVSLNGILSVIGRLITGLLVNFKKTNVIWLYSGCLSVVAVTTVIYPFIANFFEGHVIFNLILGLFFGNGYLLVSPLCSYFVDIEFVSAAIGFVLFFGGAGSLFGPMFASILLDNGGTYDQCLYTAACFVLAASVLGLFTSCFQQNKRVISSDTDITALSYSPK